MKCEKEKVVTAYLEVAKMKERIEKIGRKFFKGKDFDVDILLQSLSNRIAKLTLEEYKSERIW